MSSIRFLERKSGEYGIEERKIERARKSLWLKDMCFQSKGKSTEHPGEWISKKLFQDSLNIKNTKNYINMCKILTEDLNTLDIYIYISMYEREYRISGVE